MQTSGSVCRAKAEKQRPVYMYTTLLDAEQRSATPKGIAPNGSAALPSR